jgi:hypothetical protein
MKLWSFLFLLGFGLVCAFGINAAEQVNLDAIKSCPLDKAIYELHTKEKFPYKLRMKFSFPDKEISSIKFFVHFLAYDNKDTLRSEMRTAYSCSGGLGVCQLSAYWGQYNQLDDLQEFKSDLSYDFIPLDKNFYDVNSFKKDLPYFVIIPKFGLKLQYFDWSNTKYFIKGDDQNLWKSLDFLNANIWQFSKCK